MMLPLHPGQRSAKTWPPGSPVPRANPLRPAGAHVRACEIAALLPASLGEKEATIGNKWLPHGSGTLRKVKLLARKTNSTQLPACSCSWLT